jgi:hypothetical protein
VTLGRTRGLAATQAEEEVVPASAFRTQHDQIRELQRLLGKKTLETEILKEALEVATDLDNDRYGCCRCHRTIPDDRDLLGEGLFDCVQIRGLGWREQ